MTRTYLVFGSDDATHWEMLKPVVAGGSQQALNKAREQEAHRHYAAVPERNWAEATPDIVERQPVVKWEAIPRAQRTIDDEIDRQERQEKVKEAREVLATAPATTTTPDESESE